VAKKGIAIAMGGIIMIVTVIIVLSVMSALSTSQTRYIFFKGEHMMSDMHEIEMLKRSAEGYMSVMAENQVGPFLASGCGVEDSWTDSVPTEADIETNYASWITSEFVSVVSGEIQGSTENRRSEWNNVPELTVSKVSDNVFSVEGSQKFSYYDDAVSLTASGIEIGYKEEIDSSLFVMFEKGRELIDGEIYKIKKDRVDGSIDQGDTFKILDIAGEEQDGCEVAALEDGEESGDYYLIKIENPVSITFNCGIEDVDGAAEILEKEEALEDLYTDEDYDYKFIFDSSGVDVEITDLNNDYYDIDSDDRENLVLMFRIVPT